MRDQLRKTIELLRQHVQKNLEIIHQNERKVREILREPVTNERSERLSEKYSKNKDMLQENNEFIKLQLSIVRLLDKYKQSLDYSLPHSQELKTEYKEFEPEKEEKRPEKPVSNSDTKEELRKEYLAKFSREDYMELTANEMMPFDEHHPYFHDESFIDELLERFIQTENYEMCAHLQSLKED
jgi:hypothetical protein